ncbi:MAG TPA: hypothetical protein V6D12_06110 [Candidatus Obscuribacterales bacterium]
MPLSNYINRLPLILAGPILRRTQPDAVTVWLALKEPREVTLKVYSTEANGLIINDQVLEGSRSTVQLGKYLHLVAVTAKSVHQLLQPGQIYAYDLDFGEDDQSLATALNLEGFLTSVIISYFDHQLPTFAMPPDDLNHLRIVHGSCRKPHGGGQDALTILDNLIEQNATLPNSRPQQLFLTGDQIYGDDVADPLLWAVTKVGDTLLGWEENLPLKKPSATGYEYNKPSDLKPGQRSDIAKDNAGFTAMLFNQPEKAKSHLFSLGEYYAMYLFAWSLVVWPDEFPKNKNVKHWDQEVAAIEQFSRNLPKVRRALANVSTYMICDDHDISDDWYLNREWCNRVLGKPLGKRVVQNGLLAYAVFQAWGNTPDQFEDGQTGGKLLEAAQKWSLSAGTDESAWEDIAKYLGLPLLEPKTDLPQLTLDEDLLILDRDYPDGTPPLDWHYTVSSFKHEVIVFDTRTWRGYPNEDSITNLPMLLSHRAFDKQLRQSLKETSESDIEITLVVLPTNLVSLWVIDLIQEMNLKRGKVFQNDVGDSWTLNKVALAKLLAELFKWRDRVVVLSGDIHYAGAVRLSYWLNNHREASEKPRVLAQLTSSGFKNAEWKTYFIHTKLKSLAPELPQNWAGWNNPPQLFEIQTIQQMVRLMKVEVANKSPLIRQIYNFCGNWEIFWEIVVKDKKFLPDWRYQIQWSKRQKAQEIPNTVRMLSEPYKKNYNWLRNLVSLLWRNNWIQEGEEVVGHNNLGLVSFQWSHNNEDAKAVIQDVYWEPPWKPTSIVSSRYFVSLELDEPPPPMKVISQ